MLRIAVQKSGRLSEDSLRLIRECGIHFSNGVGRLKASAHNFPIEFLLLRDDDIPGYVADGVADIGIVGLNVVEEKARDLTILMRLGFSRCRLSLAIPRNEEYTGIEQLNGKSIATSYPRLLDNYLKTREITADIHVISGSVEIAPSIGLAYAVCDIVSSGSTLLSNGLREVEEIFASEAVLVGHKGIGGEKKRLLDQLLFRIRSVQNGANNKYILLNAPNHKIEEISRLLPGMRSPTVLPLLTEGWSSIHSVINEDRFWEIIEKLKEAGAEGILVVPIEKMIQ